MRCTRWSLLDTKYAVGRARERHEPSGRLSVDRHWSCVYYGFLGLGSNFSTSFGSQGGSHMALTLDEANKIVAGAVAKAQEMNIKISVAVCDAGGRLVAFNRMDGAIWGSVYGSQGKAVASAGF